MRRSPITTHVLDIAKGRPAAGVAVRLAVQGAGGWKEIANGVTDSDGRAGDLLPSDTVLQPGVYKLTFDTENYLIATGSSGFYPYVPVVFTVSDPKQHYHVPLLLSPFGYTTYCGS